MLATFKLKENTKDILAGEPWEITTAAEFATQVRNEEIFEKFLTQVLWGPGNMGEQLGLTLDTAASSPWAGRMFRLWKAAWDCMNSASVPAPTVKPPDEATSLLTPTGVELPPPRLRPEDRTAMFKSLVQLYPGHVLNDATTPGDSYLALIYADSRPGKELKWYPWVQVLSMAQEEQIRQARATRVPRSELAAIANLLWTDTMQREDEVPGSPYALEKVLGLTALALVAVGRCHLQPITAYHMKFMALYTERFEPDLNMRPPNVKEAQAAYLRVGAKVAALVNQDQWSLNDALHEYTAVRPDMDTLMQPRPKAPPAQRAAGPIPPVSGKGKSRASTPASASPGATGGGKARAKGVKRPSDTQTERSARQRVDWPEGWAKQLTSDDGSVKGICMRWNLTGCALPADRCRFLHVCPVQRGSDGSVCGGNHKGSACPLAGGRVSH